MMLFPCIRPGIAVRQDNEQTLRFAIYSHSEQITFEADSVAKKVISLLNGKHRYQEILSKACEIDSTYSGDKLTEVLDMLETEGLIYDANDTIAINNLAPEYQLYKRQIEFWTSYLTSNRNPLSVQEKLLKTTVSVIGAGGLGNSIISLLARCGVGHIRVIDGDKVEAKNISNQCIFSVRDIGKSKCQAISDWVQNVGLKTNIEYFEEYLLKEEDIYNTIRNSDFVFHCADVPSVRESSTLVSNCCMSLKIPHIVGGGYSGHRGALGTTIIPGKTFCWNCYLNSTDENDETGEEIIPPRNSGSFGPLINLVASIQVWDFIRVICNLGDPLLSNRFGDLFLNTLTIRWSKIVPQGSCNYCKKITENSLTKEKEG